MEQNTSNITPNAPANPPAPEQSPTLTVAPKKSKKGLIIGLICGGVALIGLIVTVILLVVFSNNVSRQDYRDAHTMARNLVQTINESERRIESLLGDVESISQEDLEMIQLEIKDIQEELRLGIRELGNTTAIRRDNEAAEKFRALEAAKEEFTRDINLMLEVYDQAMPIFVDMIDIGNKFQQIDDEDQVYDLITELRNLANAAFEVDTSSSAINFAMHDIGEAMYLMADILDRAMDGDDSIMGDLMSAMQDLDSAGNDFTSEVEKLSNSGQNLTDKLNELGQYLTNQANR